MRAWNVSSDPCFDPARTMFELNCFLKTLHTDLKYFFRYFASVKMEKDDEIIGDFFRQ